MPGQAPGGMQRPFMHLIYYTRLGVTIMSEKLIHLHLHDGKKIFITVKNNEITIAEPTNIHSIAKAVQIELHNGKVEISNLTIIKELTE
jgi:antitoxin component of MazEF toxin-antitoxin module